MRALSKTLAVIALLGAGTAQADVSPLPSSGGSDAFLTIVDTNLNNSLIIDLNQTFSALLPSAIATDAGFTISLNLSTLFGTAVTNFLTASAGNFYSWWISAADSQGLGAFGGRRIMTTSAVGAAANITNQFVTQATTAVSNYLGVVNSQNTTNCADTAVCFASNTDSAWANQTTWSARWNGQLPLGLNNGFAALGQAQGFVMYTTPESATAPSGSSAARTIYGNAGGPATWVLELVGGQAMLTYNLAPNVIPIPAAVWLLLSGLVGLTAVGRRKRALA